MEDTFVEQTEDVATMPEGQWLNFGDAMAKYNLSNSFLSSKRDKIRRHGRYYNEDDIIACVNEPSYIAAQSRTPRNNGNSATLEGFISKADALRKYDMGSSYLYKRVKDGTIKTNDQGLLDENTVIEAVSDPIYQARSAARKAKKNKRTATFEVKAHKRVVRQRPQEQHEPQQRQRQAPDLEHYHAAYAAGWIASWINTYCAQSGDVLSAKSLTRRVCQLLLGS